MSQRKWVGWIAVAALALMLASGCAVLPSEDSAVQIDPPPEGANVEGGELSVPASAQGTEPSKAMEVTLYFKDSSGFVVPLSVPMPATERVAQQSLEYMVEGGPGQALLPEGFTPLIPKGTEVRPINIDFEQKLAVVDFSEEFTRYNPQDERKILEAITWTLTGFPTIDKVRLQVKGVNLTEMPVNGTPLDEPLTRAMGINLEAAPGVDPGRSTAVTVYFLKESAENFTYLVPVTRLTDRTDNVAVAAMEELIKGPLGNKDLLPVLNPQTEILDVQHQNEMVTANFSEQLLDANHAAPAEALESVVLSLSENTGAGKVQIMVNGEAKVVADDRTDYSKPVARPVHPNKYTLQAI